MEGRVAHLSQRLKNALEDFRQSLAIDLSSLDARTVDAVKNGHIQKFEFCVAFFWKTVKAFLNEIHGYDLASPKGVIKKYFELGYVDYETLEALLEGIDIRNSLNHLYKKELFEDAYRRVIRYPVVFDKAASPLFP